ncbi:MAG: TetR/AcrR family transcriptional regulator [Bacillota bacterium]
MTEIDGFERRRRRKKERILQAAAELFSRRERDRVTVRQIAARAGVSPVTIYNYFGSKDGLVRSVVTRFTDEQFRRFEELVERDLSFREKVEKMLLDNIEVNRKYAMLIEMIALDDPAVQELIAEYYETRTLPMLMSIIEQGRREGCLDPGISAEAILTYFNMFAEAVSRPGFLSRDNEKMRADMARLFFGGLLGGR